MSNRCRGARFNAVAVALLFSALLVGRRASAQQNFFNVPASDVTRKNKLFFQEQINVLITQKKLQSNSHFAYGVGWDLELGFNVSHVNIKPFDRRVIPINTRDRSEPFNPLFLFTAQKAFTIDENFRIAVGTQTGVNFGAPAPDKRLATLNYANLVLLLPNPHARLVAGGYFGNDVFLGAGSGFGFWAGAELQILPERVHLVADWISGSHDLGMGVVGANVFLTPDVSLVFGPILANPGSGNGTGYVIELNMLDLVGTITGRARREETAAHGRIAHVPVSTVR